MRSDGVRHRLDRLILFDHHVSVSFGYKTQWVAVRSSTAAAVTAALGLSAARPMDYSAGCERAYQSGVYVADPTDGWVLAHGALTLGAWLDATDTHFSDRLKQLSAALGEVQFFATNRIVEYHAWAMARDGQLVRSYCYVGEGGHTPPSTGEPTTAETALNLGASDGRAVPSEDDVLHIAGMWSLDPTSLSHPPESGLYAQAMQLTVTACVSVSPRRWEVRSRCRVVNRSTSLRFPALDRWARHDGHAEPVSDVDVWLLAEQVAVGEVVWAANVEAALDLAVGEAGRDGAGP